MVTSRETHIIRSDRIHYSFADEIRREPGGEHLFSCSPCGTCTGTCPIPRVDPQFNPRKLLLKATRGLRDDVLSAPEIWQCSACDMCYARCPHRVRISDVMGAIRAIALREGYERPGPTAAVDAAQCTGCGRCVAACPYEAIALRSVAHNRVEKVAAQVERNRCAGCGICNAVCPSSSIAVDGHSDRELHESLLASTHALRRLSGRRLAGTVVALVCQWCLRSRDDLEVAASPPEGVEVVRVPCAGRVSPLLVLAALRGGADAVLTVGCQREECHYRQGSRLEENRLAALRSLMNMMGIDARRLRYARVGSLDRGAFEGLIEETARDAQWRAAAAG